MIALDEIGGLSHAFRQGDEMKHSSGVSQSRRGDEQFVILQYITSPIAGFHVTEFPLWKLGCLLDEDWLEEDVLNAMAELLYFRIAAEADDVDFVYLPTLAFNDARRLYASDKPVYGPNLTAFHHLLSEEPIETVAFNVWHNDHYHAFRYNSTDGSLIHGDSQHGSAPGDVLPIINWLLRGTSYPHPRL